MGTNFNIRQTEKTMLDWSQYFLKKSLHKSCIELMKERKIYLHNERLVSSDDSLYLKKSLVSLKQKISRWEKSD